MPDEKTGCASQSRRDFVRTSARVAVTAPAARAVIYHILDDFTFGNTHEDIDAISLGSNFNPDDGKPQQDDHIT